MAVLRTQTDRPRGAARRTALIEATLQILAEVGADAVTHRRVAEVAGLPLASTTYWFDSKEDLLTAALHHAAEQDITRLEAFAASAQHTEDPIGTAVGAVVGPADVRSPAGRSSLLASYTLLLEAARRPALRDLSLRWTNAYLDALEPMLELAGSGSPRADAELLLAAADGLLMDQLALGGASDPTSRLRRMVAALVRPA
ncbi:MAG TPA: TetR family transcriptional regulator [Solirubrobacteraceae bacterium]|jgi:DNA-binding transcriptional regulator YbjK|nr:TetR family transcriptional regulator [Solirubrobacteraceae bacterium]